jgi:hypothetical protein
MSKKRQRRYKAGDRVRKQLLPEVLDVKDGDRSVVASITTKVVDRDGDVMLPSGADLTHFEKSPAVFFNHNYQLPPVGRCVGFKRTDDDIQAKTVFARRPDGHEGEWLPDTLFSLFQQGVIKGFSVGFEPREGRAPTVTDLSRWGDECRYVHTKWRMLEYSVAPLPANQEALASAVSKGIITVSGVKSLFGVKLDSERIDELVRPRPAIIEVPEMRKHARIVKVRIPRMRSRKQEELATRRAARDAVAKDRGKLYSE